MRLFVTARPPCCFALGTTLTLDGIGGCSPSEKASEMIALVTAINSNNGIANSLDAKLSCAVEILDDLNDNDTWAALGSLELFLAAVRAQSGTLIPTDDADDLVASAAVVTDMLGGLRRPEHLRAGTGRHGSRRERLVHT